MEKTKVLFITHEMDPFTKLSELGKIANTISKGMQQKGMEVRVFMPRFGKINERRHRLHEVIRLSGINIQVGEEDNPMIIKVASLPSAKMQVYFLDNEDLYKRKSYFKDENEKYHEDNDERFIFFNKGVIEILLKLGWTPDIVHCHGWYTSLVPLYARTLYKKEPVFKDSKFLFTAYEPCFKASLGNDFLTKTLLNGIAKNEEKFLDNPCIDDLHQAGISYSDGIVLGGSNCSSDVTKMTDKLEKPLLKLDNEMETENLTEAYYEFYNRLLERETV